MDALAALLARGNPAPYAGTIRLPGARRGDRHRLARAVPAPRPAARRVRPDQGHRPHRRRTCCRQGPRRERDDRRPGPQRPGPGLRDRARSPCPSCAPSSSTPAWSTWSRPCAASCARAPAGRSCSPRPSRPARSPARPSPARCGSSRSWRPAPRGPYCGGGRLGRRRPRHRRAGRRHPHLLVDRAGRARAALRHRRRHHLGLRPRAGVGGDRAEGGPAARGSVGGVRGERKDR